MSRHSTLFALLLAFATPSLAGAQSILSAAGLGIPVSAVDARTRALGGVGVGLRGDGILPGDPEAAAGLTLGSVAMTSAPSWVSYSNSATGESGTFRAAHFPMVGIAYPAFGWGVITLSFESVLDQRYQGSEPATVSLADTMLAVTDSFTSSGGVSQMRLGFARPLGKDVAVGISVARYGGSLTRRLIRTFNDTIAGGGLSSFQSGGFWDYAGTSITGGISANLTTFAHVAGSVTWSGKLKAKASSGTRGLSATFDLPVEVRLGATGVIAPGLDINAGFTRADWSGVKKEVTIGSAAGATTTWGAGLELTRASLLGHSTPLRVGYRHSDLPFSLSGAQPVETAWAGGLGFIIRHSQSITNTALDEADVDVAFESGRRIDGPVTETFKRLSITLRLTGY